MASLTTMQGLWGLIESMSLTSRNKKWLADKLMESTPAKKAKPSTPAKEAVARLSAKTGKTYNKEEQEILEGFYDAIQELKEIKAGRAQTRSFDDFIAEVEQKETAGFYD